MNRGEFSQHLPTRGSDAAERPDALIGERILGRLGVAQPYFDLHDLRLHRNTLLGVARATFAPSKERGPMGMAEVCRHACVAGASIVAWRQRDDLRRYYLPQTLRLSGFACGVAYGTPVDVAAEVLELQDDRALCLVKATLGNLALAEVEVGYRILTEAAFEAAHGERYRPTPPYVRPIWTLPQAAITREGSSLIRSTTVHPASCQGHFEHYPALPLALAAGEFVTLAASQLGDSYRCTRLDLDASDTARAGDKLRFGLAPTGRSGNGASFRGQVYRGRERLIRGELELSS